MGDKGLGALIASTSFPPSLPMSVLREEILAFRRENCHPQALKNQERIGGGEEGKREGEKGEKGGTMGRPGGKT